ncbi:MAG TPA: relaxase, partial [Hyphomicrobiales bacterium]|nr:relaxase [Hyphomicrobiales bacterium]
MTATLTVSRGTRCTQFLFSVSLNPPEDQNVKIETFENAIDRIEEKNGLTGQPRVVIFHEKEGRRHAHAVWSRIDAETMTARNLSHFKLKLRDISRE